MFVEALGEGGVKRCQLVAAVGRAELMSSREFLQEPQLVDRLDHGSQHRSSNPEQDRSVSRNRTIGPYATGGSGVGGLSRERGVETALRWTRAHVPSAAKPAVDPPTTNPGVSLGSKRSGPEYWTPAKLRQITGAGDFLSRSRVELGPLAAGPWSYQRVSDDPPQYQGEARPEDGGL